MTTNVEKSSVGNTAVRKVFVALISTIKPYDLVVVMSKSLYKDSSHNYFIKFKNYYI